MAKQPSLGALLLFRPVPSRSKGGQREGLAPQSANPACAPTSKGDYARNERNRPIPSPPGRFREPQWFLEKMLQTVESFGTGFRVFGFAICVFGTKCWVFGTRRWVFGTTCWVFGTGSWVFGSAVGEIPTRWGFPQQRSQTPNIACQTPNFLCQTPNILCQTLKCRSQTLKICLLYTSPSPRDRG